MEPNPLLHSFLEPYETRIRSLTLELRSFVTDLVPDANELIWDNYNALAIAYSHSLQLKDAFCHISVYSKHINFGFNRGAELSKTDLQLLGKGKLIRHIKVKEFWSFPKDEVSVLVKAAVERANHLNPDLMLNQNVPVSIVKSVSEKKKRPNSKA